MSSRNSCSSAVAFLARLNAELERRGLGRVVIVGGFAVELYSGGVYRTGDVDFVLDTHNPQAALEVFTALANAAGWRRVSRVWEGPSPLYLDLVGLEYLGRVKELWACGSRLYVQSPEDSVVSSLAACVLRNSPADCERAAAVLAAQWEQIDWAYLRERAKREEVLEKLVELADKVARLRG
ncbi:conserved hypothetical protein [Pyrobaculum islandicum DSM 4184]|uniref:Uncharacterized protein n=1 Tax=Pyrobaculum islandicum (strain DSM 4184 / JCM 9189 / GEO3) TaxID=384616 RepID=A1RR39_PYRIL|nr:nucleotidyltransferase [Pyrobaculum islandicum]ABL87421.1 conserved hypothetical protein [Pyrobaculum islandicum DSM 4184]